MAMSDAERQRRHRDRLRNGPAQEDYSRALAVLYRRAVMLQQAVQHTQTIADGLVVDLGMVLGVDQE